MLKRIYLSSVFLLFAVSLFMGADRICHRRSSHFSFSKIRRSNLFSPDWGTPLLSAEEKANLHQILNQKFILYDKSARVYVCVSEDGNYILKILKYQHLNTKSWLAHLPFSVNPYYQEFLFKKKKYDTVLTAWKSAFTELKEETGLIYMHTHDAQLLRQKVVILDKNVQEHSVDLDKVIFCVQKHADLLYLKIAQLMHDKDLAGAQAIINSVFSLIERLSKKGAIDRNFYADLNLGLLRDQVIQVNIGKLHVDPTRACDSACQHEIDVIMKPFKNWIDWHYPELSSHFESCLAELRRAG